MNINLLPGPVNIPLSVKECFSKDAISHRNAYFADLHHNVNQQFMKLGLPKVQLIQGSGTLANDFIAQQLNGIDGKGCIIENGEFGKRLVRQATATNLCFDVLHLDSLIDFDIENFEVKLFQNKYKWCWFVHCETSTGLLNPLYEISLICKKHKMICAVDAISTIGNLPVKLKDLDFVSCSSGKGLSSYPGISIVLYKEILNLTPTCHYLDLAFHASQNYIPFTLSSNMLEALNAGIEFSLNEAHYQHIVKLSKHIVKWQFYNFKSLSFKNINPSVFTFIVSKPYSSVTIGDYLSVEGISVNYLTTYLKEANTFQLCLMGNLQNVNLEKVYLVLKNIDQLLKNNLI